MKLCGIVPGRGCCTHPIPTSFKLMRRNTNTNTSENANKNTNTNTVIGYCTHPIPTSLKPFFTVWITLAQRSFHHDNLSSWGWNIIMAWLLSLWNLYHHLIWESERMQLPNYQVLPTHPILLLIWIKLLPIYANYTPLQNTIQVILFQQHVS